MDAEAHAEEDRSPSSDEAEARTTPTPSCTRTEKLLASRAIKITRRRRRPRSSPPSPTLKRHWPAPRSTRSVVPAERLMTTSQDFTQKLYEAAAAADRDYVQGNPQGESTEASDDDVVDADDRRRGQDRVTALSPSMRTATSSTPTSGSRSRTTRPSSSPTRVEADLDELTDVAREARRVPRARAGGCRPSSRTSASAPRRRRADAEATARATRGQAARRARCVRRRAHPRRRGHRPHLHRADRSAPQGGPRGHRRRRPAVRPQPARGRHARARRRPTNRTVSRVAAHWLPLARQGLGPAMVKVRG